MYSGVSRWLTSGNSSLLQGCWQPDVGRRSARHERMNPLRGWTRETRLLVVTVLLAVSVLLALARLRFPGAEPSARLSLPVRPLQQIVERASFDDLAASVTRAADRIRPALAVVSLPAAPLADHQRGSRGTTRRDAVDPRARHALHVGDDRWVALVTGAAGADVTSRRTHGRRRDPLRGIVVLTGNTDDRHRAQHVASGPPIAFLVAAEPTAAGVAVRPVFVPASEPISDHAGRRRSGRSRRTRRLRVRSCSRSKAHSSARSSREQRDRARPGRHGARRPPRTSIATRFLVDRRPAAAARRRSLRRARRRGGRRRGRRGRDWERVNRGSSRAGGCRSRRWTVPPSRRRMTCCSAWRLPIRRRASISIWSADAEHVRFTSRTAQNPLNRGRRGGRRDATAIDASLGAQLVPSARGSRVRAVDPGSPAERARPGGGRGDLVVAGHDLRRSPRPSPARGGHSRPDAASRSAWTRSIRAC